LCEPLPNDVTPASMAEVGGSIWLATERDGVFRRTTKGWEQIAASRALGGGRTFKLRPGTQESVWVLSLGMPTRVIDRPGTPEGWEVVEVLSAWHGQPSGGASDLIEEADGTIWTATAAGLVRIPAHARRVPLAAPAVRLAGLYVDGQSVPVDRPLRLAYRTKLVEMRFAALTFRDRSRLRYQIRLSSDSGWLDLTTGGPAFRFPNPPAGEHVALVRATIDGRTWSAEGQRLAFAVDGPWYFRPWFVALAIAAVAALLAAVHRARLQLAVRLERQRTGIAMDLHDEIGSGLGSIGILAGVAAAGTRDRGVLREIGETASELSAALSDIVWSLRAGERTVPDLVGHIADRGHRLFPDGAATFEMHAPESLAAEPLSLAVQRSVLLILMEALHNAARHARARRVEVGVARDGERWRVRVSDDGRGFDPGACGAGVGLTSMRRRAEQIGASLAVHSRPGEGTLVSLSFDPRGRNAWRGAHITMRGPRRRRSLR
jgi:signal transduction histidine kinase